MLDPCKHPGISALVLLALCTAGALGWALMQATSSPGGPVELMWDRESCANCKMLVGEPNFAVQLQTEDGRVFAFDDPGCLILFLEDDATPVRAIYFHHLHEGRWIGHDEVAFESVSPSPMGFGLGAIMTGDPDSIDLDEARRRVLAIAGREEK